MDVEFARRQMIDQQVRAWEVLDQDVLTALTQVPRETFVPPEYRDLAFADTEIPLGHAQRMLAPKVEGRIMQVLKLRSTDQVLEIGTGSGYLSACLGKLAASVQSLEIFPNLAEKAIANLYAAAINNVAVRAQDATKLEEQSRYDAIAVTGSLPIYDERYQRALKIGGRLFVVVGEAPIMEAWLVTRTGEREWTRESVFETIMQPLLHTPRRSPFIF